MIKTGIRDLRSKGIQPQTMGIDTFGNGYGLLDDSLALLELPYFYKDTRTKGILSRMGQVVPIDELYRSQWRLSHGYPCADCSCFTTQGTRTVPFTAAAGCSSCRIC